MDRIFNTRTALLIATIVRLSRQIFQNCQPVADLIEALKVNFENHLFPDSQEIISNIKLVIVSHSNSLSNYQKRALLNIADFLTNTIVIQTVDELFKNMERRAFESQYAVDLLLSPPAKMMNAVGAVSRNIIKMICMNMHIDWEPFLKDCNYNPDEYIGCFHGKPSLEQVCDVLLLNQKKHLPNIMLIHIRFWYFCKDSKLSGVMVFPEWVYRPIGEFVNFIKSRAGNLNYLKFIRQNAADNEIGYLSDVLIYKSDLYLERGRGSIEKQLPTSYLGIMLPEQQRERFKTGLLPWCPDVVYQKPKLDSMYFNKLLDHEAIYVAGPSGLASILLSLMEIVGNLSSLKEKQYYVAAMVAYIVAGGLHSIHEVLEPAEVFLKLLPGYKTISSNSPPSLHDFFSLFSKDQDFCNIRQKSWEKFINYLGTFTIADKKYRLREELKIASNIARYSLFSHSLFNKQSNRLGMAGVREHIHNTNAI